MKTERICLDTDIIEKYLMNDKEAVTIIEAVQETADCAITAMSIFELFCLAEQSNNTEENRAVVQEFVDRLTILQWTPVACLQAAKLFTELEKHKKKPEIRDILVGVLAKQQKRTMISFVKERYKWVPGLKLYK
jgi:predicted nucleic acid-binding protein